MVRRKKDKGKFIKCFNHFVLLAIFLINLMIFSMFLITGGITKHILIAIFGGVSAFNCLLSARLIFAGEKMFK